MKSKPWAIKAISISLLLVPFALLILLYVSKSIGRTTQISAGMIELIALFGVASIVAAYSVWRVRPWGYILLFIFGAVIIGADTQQLIANPKSLNPFYFVDLILVVAAFFLMSRSRVREAYFNPKIRWWERPERHPVKFDGVFEMNGDKITAPILDISIGGCFVDLHKPNQIGETMKIQFNQNGVQLTCVGRIVRSSEDPRGIGIMFMNLSRSDRKQIKQIIKGLISLKNVA